MSEPSSDNWEKLRGQIIGLGEHSARKSYYPELQQRIRELEETRATLAASNRQLQAVLDAASEVAIIATDPDGLITLFNHGAQKMLGYGAPEVVGKQTPLIFHLGSEVEARARILSRELGRQVSGFKAFVENAQFLGPENREWTYVRKDGATLLVNLIVTAIHDEHGAINGFLGIAEDITRHKVMEHQIIENEKLLGTIINSIPNPIFYKDVKGVYTGCNDAFCSHLGMPRERIVGTTVFDIAPPDMAVIYHQTDMELMDRPGTLTYETTIVYADGTVHDVIFYKSSMLDSGGTVCGLVGVILDITDRKRVEQELAQKEELFHLLFEKSGDANLLIDGEVFIDCNSATLRMLGYQDKQQVIFAHPSDLSPEYQPDGQLSSVKASEMIKLAYEQGSHRLEWLHTRGDGTELPVEVMLTAIPMNDRTIIHTAWRDLTERKRAEAENDRLTHNLLHSQKIESIGRLAAGVAHDFNNLLMPIIGYAEMLQEFCASDERAAQRLRGISHAAGKASDLTRQLLAFGRKQVLEMKAIDLNQTIETFRLILEHTIREDVHVELHLDPGLGAILADVSQIEQIIMNLVINAQDAMPSGGTLVVETTNCQLGRNSLSGPDLPPGPYVKLVVSDNGSGMDKETLKCIFEPFYTTKEQGKGTGLGLAMVFGIVKQHGGNINVYSEVGHGSTFSIYFPRLAEFQQSEEVEVTQAELSPLERDTSILVVEDSQLVRELAIELLTGRGYRVLVAETPTQARAVMEQNRGTIDLLLSDVIMPEKNGLELYDELKRLWPPLKVLFMSGYSENIVTHQIQSAHNFNYIQKPFSAQDLFSKINEILSH